MRLGTPDLLSAVAWLERIAEPLGLVSGLHSSGRRHRGVQTDREPGGLFLEKEP